MLRSGMVQAIAAVCLGLLAPPLPTQAAVLPGIAESPASEAEPEARQIIAAGTEGASDERIARRISGIFGELQSLEGVAVSAKEGVVTLRGKVAAPEDIKRAEAIAARVAGVVTVENRIERDLSMENSVGAIQTVSGRLAGLVKILPLAGAAIAVAAVIALLGYLLASLGMVWRRFAPNQFLAELIASAVRFVFVLGGIIVGLDMLGAGALLGAVLGGAGIIGIALGFAMRDTIENYVASILLSVRQPFRPNDHVVIDSYEGRVIRLTSRATILMTLDGNHLRVPNSAVFKAVILNYTTNPQRRFEFDLGIDADDDANAGRGVGRAALAALPFVLDEPAPEARVVDVGDSNIVIRFLGWVDQREADWFKARSRAIAAVKKALEDGGFVLPEPIYRLRFDPRTQPLPFEHIEHRPGGETGAVPPLSPAPSIDEGDQDVAPLDEVAGMVERERKEDPKARKDLLDPDRPVE